LPNSKKKNNPWGKKAAKTLAAAMAGACILLSMLGLHVPALVVSWSDGVVLAVPMYIDHTFNTEFLHSVEKTLVREYYTLTPEDTFLLTATDYVSYGAGLPFAASDGHYELHDGFIRITAMNRPVPYIRLMYIAFIDYKLTCGGHVYPLADYIPADRALVAIKAQPLSLWQAIWYSVRY
jgi:hypothetical protein